MQKALSPFSATVLFCPSFLRQAGLLWMQKNKIAETLELSTLCLCQFKYERLRACVGRTECPLDYRAPMSGWKGPRAGTSIAVRVMEVT